MRLRRKKVTRHRSAADNLIVAVLTAVYAASAVCALRADGGIRISAMLLIMALSSGCLVYLGRGEGSAWAALRYIILQTAAAAAMLTGFTAYMFHYGEQEVDLALCTGEPCYWLIAAGLAAGAAVFPFHPWSADAAGGAGHYASPFIPAFTAGTYICLMIRLMPGSEWLAWLGAAGAVISAWMTAVQNDLRRITGYAASCLSSVCAAGIALGSQDGRDAAAMLALIMTIGICILMLAARLVERDGCRGSLAEMSGSDRRINPAVILWIISAAIITSCSGISDVIGALSGAGYRIQAVMITVSLAGLIISLILRPAAVMLRGEGSRVEGEVSAGEASEGQAVNEKEPDKKAESRVPQFFLSATAIICCLGLAIISFAPGILPAVLKADSVLRPYSMQYALRYAAVFCGAALPYIALRKLTAPRDIVILDIDWLIRKPAEILIVKKLERGERTWK